MEHQVQGKAIMPGAGLLEMADAAGHLSKNHAASSLEKTASGQVLSRCVISAPVFLITATMANHLQVSLDKGRVVVSRPSTQTTHMTSYVQQCWSSSDGTCAHPQPLHPDHTKTLFSEAILCRSQHELTQTAHLHVDRLWHMDGYCSHPAIVDGCLHLGASLAHISTEQVALRVPATVDLYSATTHVEHGPWNFHAKCQLHGQPTLRGSAYSSYSMQGNNGEFSRRYVNGLEARPIPLKEEARDQPAVQNAVESKLGIMYNTEWEAVWPRSELDPGTGAVELPAALCSHCSLLQTCEPTQMRLSTCSKRACPANVVAPLSAILPRLQQATQGSAAGDRNVQVVGCSSGWCSYDLVAAPVNLVGAAVAGMVRVASSEAAKHWFVTEVDHVASDGFFVKEHDSAGTRIWHAVALRPLLKPLVHTRAKPQSARPPVSFDGVVALTGGLGGELPSTISEVWHLCKH